MKIQTGFVKIKFPSGFHLGGYGLGYKSEGGVPLEANVLKFFGVDGREHRIICIDALYPGDLVGRVSTDDCIVASHTHYSPMIDSLKPALGEFQSEALDIWAQAIEGIEYTTHDCSKLHILESTPCDVPIYRRYDTPNAFLGRLINRFIGMHPNMEERIDRTIKVFTLGSQTDVSAIIVWHCCHPVSRSSRRHYSADYVDTIRQSLRDKFGNVPILFFLGPSGDVRPNLVAKRFQAFPNIWLNRKFKKNVEALDQNQVDNAYANILNELRFVETIPLSTLDLFSIDKKMHDNSVFESKALKVSDRTIFELWPYEVSHRYHRLRSDDGLIVSCTGNVRGYLPHESQVSFGGYEVDGSRPLMGIEKRIWI